VAAVVQVAEVRVVAVQVPELPEVDRAVEGRVVVAVEEEPVAAEAVAAQLLQSPFSGRSTEICPQVRSFPYRIPLHR